ncbi:hypothetical protein PUMCH_004944 [Australozyma saopauloensis]|uniref:ATP-dependent RNA helicase DRS1 n=1 Tax=Australozyma saopauloensis TaxID=291208 RepID=A0AAX4HGC4_9ASCO|nr:hypothetical protein PUMCH_004944 [[Candida] saopauloensis]
MAKSKRSKVKSDDLILTINSDSEQELPAPETDSEDENQLEGDKNINPDFQFSLDGFETTNTDAGWEFRVTEDEKPKKRKDVDLDDILRRKGGLTGLVEKDEEEQDSESDGDNEGDEEEAEGEKSDDDDDELAMDGFGMGVHDDDDEDEDEPAADEDEPSQDQSEPKTTKAGEESEGESSEDEGDSAAAMAEFYEASEEANLENLAHSTFQTLDLSRPVLKGLANLGYTKPSPIQAASIPISLLGKDIVAGAVTGSGKTAAYMIPIIERLIYKPSKVAATRVIVLAPTRELAIQVCDVGKKIARFIPSISFGLAVGGLNLRQQEQQLKSRPDIVVATPGRLIDHIRNSASFSIDGLEILVMDEADRMLEEGFQAELTEILSLIPKHKRQTMLFSATMNTKIQDLIQLSLNKPVRIMIDPPKAAASKLVQEFVRIRKKDDMKPALLFNLLRGIDPSQQSRIVIFVSRKETAHRLRVILGLLGLRVSELHGSLSQEQRLNNVNDFKNLVVPILICTDLAARGLDIPKIELVINYDMPKSHEIYLHRVGRTARAGREGKSITFVGDAASDRNIVKAAIKSLETNSTEQKAVSRNVDWAEVAAINEIVESKKDTVEEVLVEEKQAKEMMSAEMELNKADNLLKHGDQIYSKPKRTWFASEAEKKSGAMSQLSKSKNVPNSKKRKRIEAQSESSKVYKKTKDDRAKTQGKARNSSGGKTKRPRRK